MKNRITEIVTMKSAQGVGKEEFIEIVDGLERGQSTHQEQCNFIGLYLAKAL